LNKSTETPRITAEVKRDWYRKLAVARSFMEAHRSNPKVLIEIAAQHPLDAGARPNREFAVRLDRGKDLFLQLRDVGRPVELYVPGSRHQFQGKPDAISLSAAGRAYLEAMGISPECIHGDDLNERYKGEDGVYGSADECFVTAAYFKENDFGHLLSVVSPAQMLRKTLHYIQFGVLPLNYTAPAIDSYHNFLDELFEQIPYVLLVDNTLQGPTSQMAKRLREERRP
jgi:hypothetical protein